MLKVRFLVCIFILILLPFLSLGQSTGKVLRISDATTNFTVPISVGTFVLNVNDTIAYFCKKYAPIGLNLTTADTCFERLLSMTDTNTYLLTHYSMDTTLDKNMFWEGFVVPSFTHTPIYDIHPKDNVRRTYIDSNFYYPYVKRKVHYDCGLNDSVLVAAGTGEVMYKPMGVMLGWDTTLWKTDFDTLWMKDPSWIVVLGDSSGARGDKLTIDGNIYLNGGVGGRFIYGDTDTNYLRLGTDYGAVLRSGSGSKVAEFGAYGNQMQFITSDELRMRIESNGDVWFYQQLFAPNLISTTTMDTFLVLENNQIKELYINPVVWSDTSSPGDSIITGYDLNFIDHNRLINFVENKHFYQNQIDSVNNTLDGILVSDNGVLEVVSLVGHEDYITIANADGTDGNPTITMLTKGDIIAGSGITVTGGVDIIPGLSDITISATGGGSGGSSRWDSTYQAIYPVSWVNRVGIGTNSPSDTLHVVGNTTLEGELRLPSISSGTDSLVLILQGDSVTTRYLNWLAVNTALQWSDTTGGDSIITGYDLSTLILGDTNYWALNGSKIYRKDGLTSVGIGTNDPSHALDVWGKLGLRVIDAGTTDTVLIIDGGEVKKRYLDFSGGSSTYQKRPVSIDTLTDGISDNSSVHLGTGAGVNDDLTTNANTSVGINAMGSTTTGYYNTAIGHSSLYSNAGGNQNVAVGVQSLYGNISGNSNFGMGNLSLYSNTTGDLNTAIGLEALFFNQTGQNNLSIGSQSGYRSLGDNNIFIGYQAGGYGFITFDKDNNTVIGNGAGFNMTGEGNIYLGYNAGGNATGDNKLYIDNSNTATPLIYGDFSTDRVGINTNSVSEALTVNGNVYGDTAKFTHYGGHSNFTIGGVNDTVIFASTIRVITDAASNRVMVSDASGNASWKSVSTLTGLRENGTWQQEVANDSDNNWTVSFTLSSNSVISYNGMELPASQWSGAGTTTLNVSCVTYKYDKITVIQ